MTALVLEYFFCLVYVVTFTIAFKILSKHKLKWFKTICLILVSSFINFLLTGSNSLVFNEFILQNTGIWILDFIFISCLVKEIDTKNLFYSSIFEVLYILSINCFIHLINLFTDFNRDIAMSPSLQRILMVLTVNALTLCLLIVMKRVKIIPSNKILEKQSKLFTVLNYLVLYALLIIFSIEVVEVYNLVTLLVFGLSIIWALFIKILSLYIETTIKNEELIMAEMSNQYIGKYIDFYRQESENLRKIRHDLKNHQMILKTINQVGAYNQYIDEIFSGVNDLIISGNIFVDACLYVKHQEFPQINFNYDLAIKDLKFNEKDLTSILFNLIDNACKEALKNDCQVGVTVKFKNKILIIQVTNTIRYKPNFISSQGSNHGYGLKIVRSIVNKYDGLIFVDYQGDKIIFNIKINV